MQHVDQPDICPEVSIMMQHVDQTDICPEVSIVPIKTKCIIVSTDQEHFPALPSWLLPKLTAHALKASSRPDAILILPSTVCSSRVTTRNPNFQQLAKDKKLNPNQWKVH